MKVVVLAAAPQELGDLDGFVVGVGPVVAAVTATRILSRERPDAAVLIGTAGAYAGGPAIGTAIVADQLGLSYGIAAMGLGYVPRAPGPYRSASHLVGALSIPKHDVLTVGAITTDRTCARRIADTYTVEHMEAFGVAEAAVQLQIPFVAVLGITNEVGPDAHVQWLTHRDAAQQAARDAIQPLLGQR